MKTQLLSKFSKDNFFNNTIANFTAIEFSTFVEKTNNSVANYISPTYIHVYPDEWEECFYYVDYDDYGEPTFAYSLEYDEDANISSILEYKFLYSFEAKYGEKWVFENKNFPSSEYWYTEDGVYRMSDHWGKCKTCYWTLDGKEVNDDLDVLIGFCKWENFKECTNDGKITKLKEDGIYIFYNDDKEGRIGLLKKNPKGKLIAIDSKGNNRYKSNDRLYYKKIRKLTIEEEIELFFNK